MSNESILPEITIKARSAAAVECEPMNNTQNARTVGASRDIDVRSRGCKFGRMVRRIVGLIDAIEAGSDQDIRRAWRKLR